jgi:hypothetical protein
MILGLPVHILCFLWCNFNVWIIIKRMLWKFPIWQLLCKWWVRIADHYLISPHYDWFFNRYYMLSTTRDEDVDRDVKCWIIYGIFLSFLQSELSVLSEWRECNVRIIYIWIRINWTQQMSIVRDIFLLLLLCHED